MYFSIIKSVLIKPIGLRKVLLQSFKSSLKYYQVYTYMLIYLLHKSLTGSTNG